jgi:hypothetical protein
LKVPPGWSRENNERYNFRTWVADLILWSIGTDVEPQRQAALRAMQITGVAKELLREIPPNVLRDGPNAQVTGLMFVVKRFSRGDTPRSMSKVPRRRSPNSSPLNADKVKTSIHCSFDSTYLGIVHRIAVASK